MPLEKVEGWSWLNRFQRINLLENDAESEYESIDKNIAAGMYQKTRGGNTFSWVGSWTGKVIIFTERDIETFGY